MTKPFRINIFGGPGSGKSSTAAWLFAELKRLHYNIEHVSEWVKTWAWEKYVPNCYDQLYITIKQLRKEERLLRCGVPIITDSPIPLQLAYIYKNNYHFYHGMASIVKEYEKDYPAVNVWLDRKVDYMQAGRYETADQAKEMDDIIMQMVYSFSNNSIDLIKCDPTCTPFLLDRMKTLLTQNAQK